MSSTKDRNLTNSQGNFVHVVYFWLKEPANEKVRATFEASLTSFINNSSFASTKYLGTPADTDRGVIDNSYTYCLMVTFDSKEQHDQYQVEEGHLQFIEECSELWTKVVVYDSENVLSS